MQIKFIFENIDEKVGLVAKKLAGKKFSDKHTTVIDAALDLVKACNNTPEVTKISLGLIKSCKLGNGIKNVKINETTSGLKLTIRGNVYVQIIYVYLVNPKENKEKIIEIIKKFG